MKNLKHGGILLKVFLLSGAAIFLFEIRRGLANAAVYAAVSGTLTSLLVYFITRKEFATCEQTHQALKQHDQIQTVLNELLNICTKTGTLNEILGLILKRLISVKWLTIESKGCIFLAEGNNLLIAAHHGLPPALLESCKLLPFGKCLCGRAALSGKTQFAQCLDDRHEISHENIPQHGHYCIPVKSGDKILGVLNLYLKDGHKRDEREILFLEAAAGVTAGVIERFNQDKLLKEKDAQFLQAQKMEALGKLAGGVAHDFNNLLALIIGYTDVSAESLPADHQTLKYLKELKKASYKASELVKQLLAFSRKQPVSPSVFGINDSVKEMHKMLSRLIGANIEFSLSLDDSAGSIKADKNQFEQIIMNLAVNAKDAMPDGGRLSIKTSRTAIGENCSLKGEAIKPGAYVFIEVSDTGTGMDEETQARIFEPFFTTKEEGKGTGLGLSTVYGIVKQNNGHIFPESSPGAGTVFSIYLPAHDPLKT